MSPCDEEGPSSRCSFPTGKNPGSWGAGPRAGGTRSGGRGADLAAILALAAVSCGYTAGPARRAPSPWRPGHTKPSAAEPKPASPRHAKLLFELEGRPFPLPLLHGSVLGEPTWMLVDTGANSHVIAGWLARKVGLKVESHGDLGTDHAGREIQTLRAEHPAVAIDDWGPLVDAPVLVTEIPGAIEKLGIGAFISPQSLREGAAIVLDLRHGELHSAAYSDAERDLGKEGRALSPAGGIACEDTESPIKGLAYVIPGTVDDQPTMLLVDSGAERTDLLVGSRAARALASRSVANKEQLFGASGRIPTRTLRGATLTIGEWSAAKDVDLIPGVVDETCPRDGVVAMDVLGSCVLVLGPESMSARCEGP